jgi:rubredoxin
MRQMVPYPQRGPTVQFRCTECEWVFNIKNPIPDGAPVQERRKATAWFALHNCADHPRHVPKSPPKPVR